MDNREFARLLLCEATELLNEDARARYTDKKIEEARKNYQRDKKLVEHGKDPACLDKYHNEKVRITNIRDGKYDGDFVSINPVTSDKDYEHYKNARKGKSEIRCGFYGSEITRGNKNDWRANATVRQPGVDDGYKSREPFYKSSMKKAGVTERDKYDNGEKGKKYKEALKDGERRQRMHKKITERGKRSQNESIAVLLTEAALLLNDED